MNAKKQWEGAVLLAVILLVLAGIGAVALGGGQSEVLSPGEPGSGSIAGTRCVWSGGESAPVGVFAPDGSLSLSWVGTSWGRRVVYTAAVPGDVIAQCPVIGENLPDLHYLVENAGQLGLSASTVAAPLKRSAGSADPLEKNAARICAEAAQGEGAYEMRSIYISDQYAPTVVEVFETETVQAYPAGKRNGWLKRGWSASTVLALLETAGLTMEQAVAFGNEALSFAGGVLNIGVSVREFEVEARYIRTGGYRPAEGAPLTMVEGVEEERKELYRVWLAYPEETDSSNVDDFAHLVSGPAEAAVPEAFSVQSIARHIGREILPDGDGK